MNFFQKSILVLVALLALFLSGCFHRMAPGSKAGRYNQQSNNTVYTVTPYGSIILPGIWQPGKYNKASKQQYYYRADTTTLIVSVGPCSNFSFGKGEVTNFDFVKRYYETEAKFQMQLQEQTPKILVEDSIKKYMLWVVREDGIDQYYLCGVKDCACKECTYRTLTLKNRRLTEAQARALLTGIFMNP
ncbi:MAG: hypothetical protein K9G49_13895 [Taibaiella sp.]|nr:hypothetical protein [Taibaiella sp.]